MNHCSSCLCVQPGCAGFFSRGVGAQGWGVVHKKRKYTALVPDPAALHSSLSKQGIAPGLTSRSCLVLASPFCFHRHISQEVPARLLFSSFTLSKNSHLQTRPGARPTHCAAHAFREYPQFAALMILNDLFVKERTQVCIKRPRHSAKPNKSTKDS